MAGDPPLPQRSTERASTERASTEHTSTVAREIDHLLREIFNESPNRGLSAYRILTTRYMPWIARMLVLRARRKGTSWTGIGRILGVSRQAVQKRYDRTLSMADLLPPTLPAKAAGPNRDYRELLVRLRHLREHADAEASGEFVPW